MNRIAFSLLLASLVSHPLHRSKADSPSRAMNPTQWCEGNAESLDTSQQAVCFTVSQVTLSSLSGQPDCWLDAAEDARFRVLLVPSVVASLKRVGIADIRQHFEGKRVTVRGQAGALLAPSIHRQARPTIYLHVDSIERFDSVVAVKHNDAQKPDVPRYFEFPDYPIFQ